MHLPRAAMLIVTEAARARIAEELGPPAGTEPTALRLIFVENGFELVEDEIQARDVRFDHGGRTVLVMAEAVEDSFRGCIMHVHSADPNRLRLVPVNARTRGGRRQVARLTRRDRRDEPGRATRSSRSTRSTRSTRSIGPLRYRRVTQAADGAGTLVERHRLTGSQMKVLKAVFARGSLSMSELRRCCGLRGGSVQRITEGLQRRGLVTVHRTSREATGSGALVRITGGAREMLERARSG